MRGRSNPRVSSRSARILPPACDTEDQRRLRDGRPPPVVGSFPGREAPLRKLARPCFAVAVLLTVAACQGGHSDPNAADRRFAQRFAPIAYQAAAITALVPERAENPGVLAFAGDFHAEAEYALGVIDSRREALRVDVQSDAVTDDLVPLSTIRRLQDQTGAAFDRQVITLLIDRAKLSARLLEEEARDGGDPFLTGLAEQLGEQRADEAKRMEGLLSLLPV